VAELVVSNRANEELRQIWQYLAARNPTSADRLLRRIKARLERLCHFPEIGVRRDDISAGSRMLVEGYYLLLYRHDAVTDTVTLVAIVDGRRDTKDMF